MREFNFDDSIMSTPDWLWEQPAREALYDDLVAEYEIEDRIEAINQQLDYAQATMQSLKDDAHHQHSTFLEYTIVLLIAFEVLVEMYGRTFNAACALQCTNAKSLHETHDIYWQARNRMDQLA